MAKRRRSSRRRNIDAPHIWQLIGLGVVALVTVGLVAFALQSPAPPIDADRPAYTPKPVPTVTEEPVVLSPVVASQGRPAPVALVVGDSYSEGYGATDPKSEGYVPLIAAATGWEMNVLTTSGGGYTKPGVNNNGPFGRLLRDADLAGLSPDVIIIQGGINEPGTDAATMIAAVTDAAQIVRADLPTVPLVIVGLLQPTGAGPDYAQRARNAMQTATDAIDNALFIETDSLTYEVIGDRIHPNTAGYSAIAETILTQMRAAGLIA